MKIHRPDRARGVWAKGPPGAGSKGQLTETLGPQSIGNVPEVTQAARGCQAEMGLRVDKSPWLHGGMEKLPL